MLFPAWAWSPEPRYVLIGNRPFARFLCLLLRPKYANNLFFSDSTRRFTLQLPHFYLIECLLTRFE